MIKKYLTSDQYKLYKLIWSRFVASQMASAKIDTVNAEFECDKYEFRASGSTVAFAGFMAVYDYTEEDEDEKKGRLPELNEGSFLVCDSISSEQHFTEPPPRYNEGSLIKFLEEKGIGRPSTYAPIVTTIIARGYVKREGKSLKPTQLGEVTTKLMVEHFPNIVDYEFTAQMEDELDGIAHGDSDMKDVLSKFYEGFKNDLDRAEKTVTKEEVEVPVEQTDIICDKCGAKMIIRQGRYGRFAACPNYPDCKNTKPIDKDGKELVKEDTAEKTDLICEKCGKEVLKRKGRFGEFYACSDYPRCKYTKQIIRPVGVKCPKCGGEIAVRTGKNRSVYYSCENYPECDFSSWDKPVNEKCPSCGKILFLKKTKDTRYIACADKDCAYKKEISEDDEY